MSMPTARLCEKRSDDFENISSQLRSSVVTIVPVRRRRFKTSPLSPETVSAARVTPYATGTPAELDAACEGVSLIIAAGAAGVELISTERRLSLPSLKVAVDLNAVPPLGIGGVEVMDKAKDRDGVICYGAIGVGGTKMKIHRAAIARLFESNDQVLDTAAIYAIGQSL